MNYRPPKPDIRYFDESINSLIEAHSHAQLRIEVAKARAATPPQRTWVGLTDQDWKEIEDMPDIFDQGVAWAQAKLKEKNT